MTRNPVSVSAGATVDEARAFLTAKGVSGAPVIDEAGRPVGVLTHTDLVIHDRERPAGAEPPGVRVRDLMTPAVFTARPGASAVQVVEQMLGMNVHRLFVVDDGGLLVGVVSAFDVLRALRCPGAG